MSANITINILGPSAEQTIASSSIMRKIVSTLYLCYVEGAYNDCLNRFSDKAY